MKGALVLIFVTFYVTVYCDPNKQKCQGFCMEASDCPANKAEPGFCENQNEICCYGVRLSETKCNKRGGECKYPCPEKLRDPKALDCPSHQFCCILVH